MDTNQSPYTLLGHFEQPQRVVSPDFDWDETDCGASAFDPVVTESESADDSHGVGCDRPQPTELPPAQRRGVDWVLQWAGAVMVLAVAVGTLMEFASGVAVDRALRIAARAGATEATLPKATYASVTSIVEGRLAAYPEVVKHAQVVLMQNGTPVGERFVATSGDKFSVTIAAPASATKSCWLQRFTRRGHDRLIVVEAKSAVPGRKLRERLVYPH